MFEDRKPLAQEDPLQFISSTTSSVALVVVGLFVGWWIVWSIGLVMLTVILTLYVTDWKLTKRTNVYRAELREMVKKMDDGTL